MKHTAGIVGFGSYVPQLRIKAETIAEVWDADASRIIKGLGIQEKSLPHNDEDTATIAVEASRNALFRAGIDQNQIEAVYIGSESHPYAVKPTASIVAQALSIGNKYTAADTEFACKAGTAALQMVTGLVESKMIPYGLAIGADTSQSSPNNALEYSAAAGGAAFIVGNKKEEIVAGLEYTASFTSDTPDFWRRGTQQYPSHAGRFTGEPAYFKHVVSATKQLFDETGYKPEDFDHAVFHQPNGKFPMHVSKVLGFSKEQVLTGLMVPVVGNTYSGASMLGLAAVLDQAQPNQKILVTSYGSGSGSDSFVFNTTDLLTTKQSKARTTLAYVARKKYVSYAKYRQNMEFIH